MASLTLLASQEPLSLEQHLDLSEDFTHGLSDTLDGELQPLIMAQAVPDPPGEKRRVKVYELRNNDWFDRGTGFCFATVSRDAWLYYRDVSRYIWQKDASKYNILTLKPTGRRGQPRWRAAHHR